MNGLLVAIMAVAFSVNSSAVDSPIILKQHYRFCPTKSVDINILNHHYSFFISRDPVEINLLYGALGTGLRVTSVSRTGKGGKITDVDEVGEIICYTPRPGLSFNGDVFYYNVEDVYGNTAQSKVFILPKDNRKIQAKNIKITVHPYNPTRIDIIKKMIAAEKKTDTELKISGLGSPKNGGSLLQIGDGSLVYFPRALNIYAARTAAASNELDSFSFTVSDAAGNVGATANVSLLAAPAEPDTYQIFQAACVNVSVPIIQEDATAAIGTFFTSCGDSKDVSNGTKCAALGLAHGYLTLLNLTGIETTATTSQSDADALVKIIKTLGPNFFLATAWQESRFLLPGKSGYYQLDFSPCNYGYESVNAFGYDSSTAQAKKNFMARYEFLTYADRVKTINGQKTSLNVDQPDVKVFCTASIIKAYLDAINFMKMKNRLSIPDLMGFAMSYAGNTANNISVPITANTGPDTTDTSNYPYTSDTCFMGCLAVCFNRGADNYPRLPNYIIGYPSNPQPFSTGFTYKKDIDESNGDDWGQRYIYQLQTGYGILQASESYSEQITLADVTGYLDVLGDLFPATAIAAGKSAATSAMGTTSYQYNSAEFFAAFSLVVDAMIDATIVYWQPVRCFVTAPADDQAWKDAIVINPMTVKVYKGADTTGQLVYSFKPDESNAFYASIKEAGTFTFKLDNVPAGYACVIAACRTITNNADNISYDFDPMSIWSSDEQINFTISKQ